MNRKFGGGKEVAAWMNDRVQIAVRKDTLSLVPRCRERCQSSLETSAGSC